MVTLHYTEGENEPNKNVTVTLDNNDMIIEKIEEDGAKGSIKIDGAGTHHINTANGRIE